MVRRFPGPPARVVLASASVGAGHNQAALALRDAIKAAAPDVAADFTDGLEFVPRWFVALYAGGYTLGVTRFPRLYGVSYRMLNRPAGPRRSLPERARLLAERRLTRRFQRYLLERRPALVLGTHYLLAPAVGWMIGRGCRQLRLWMVVTDNEAHRFWYAENVERYFVASRRVAEQVRAWGVDPARVTVSGIPVHPKWTAPLEREKILRDWRLPTDVPIVLLSGGAYFTVGPVERIAAGILAESGAHVVVLAGSNKRLLARLSGLAGGAGRLTAVPFTDRVHELTEVASVVVTKPGGLTTAECIAKGAAMVLTRPVPGQEAANAEMLAREGAAVLAPRSVGQVVRRVAALLDSPRRLGVLRDNARRLYRPAARNIAAEVIEAVRG